MHSLIICVACRPTKILLKNQKFFRETVFMFKGFVDAFLICFGLKRKEMSSRRYPLASLSLNALTDDGESKEGSTHWSAVPQENLSQASLSYTAGDALHEKPFVDDAEFATDEQPVQPEETGT